MSGITNPVEITGTARSSSVETVKAEFHHMNQGDVLFTPLDLIIIVSEKPSVPHRITKDPDYFQVLCCYGERRTLYSTFRIYYNKAVPCCTHPHSQSLTELLATYA